MEQRVADVEECNADINEVLAYKLELQKSIQAQLTDLEALSHRNNICIHSIPERAEGDNMKAFLEGFIYNKKKKKLTSPTPLLVFNTATAHLDPGHRKVLTRDQWLSTFWSLQLKS